MARRNTMAAAAPPVPTTASMAHERAGPLPGRSHSVGRMSARGCGLPARPLPILEVYQ